MVAHGTEVCRRSTPRRPDARPPTSGSIVRGPAFALVADCRSHTVRGADAGTSPRRRLDRRCRRARRPHRLVVSPGRPRRPCSGPSRPSRSWPRLANGCDPLRGPQPACRSSTAPAGAGGPGRLALLETSTFPARRRGSVKSDHVTLGCSRHAAVAPPGGPRGPNGPSTWCRLTRADAPSAPGRQNGTAITPPAIAIFGAHSSKYARSALYRGPSFSSSA